MHEAERYASDVLSGKVKVGRLIRLSVERYYRDLDNAKKNKWTFDKDAADNAIKFCSMLKHYKGQGKDNPFILLPHQQFQFWNLYGWKKENGQRRFRRSYEEVARKNGKSTCSAARALYRILVTEPTGAQIYCAATKENQAHIIPNDASGLLLGVVGLRDLVETKKIKEHVTRVISKQEPVSYIRSLGRDSKTEDGRHASEIKVDEYHAWDSNYLLDVLEQSMKGRSDPLTDITTTAGLPYVSGQSGPCYSFRKMCIDVLLQVKVDEGLFVMIHTLDEGDDYNDKDNWHKANPALDNPGCVTIADLENDFVAAKNEGQSKWVEFLTKSLNIWTDAPKVWIADEVWMKGNGSVNVPMSLNTFSICKPRYIDDRRKWFFGFDAGRVYDFTALVGVSEPDNDGVHDVIPFYFIPDDTLEQREKDDRTTYRDWRAKNYLITTPGNATDTEFVKEFIIKLHSSLDVELTHYDPAVYAALMIAQITDVIGSAKFLGYSQAIWTSNGKGMSPPTKQMERLILQGKIRHGGHPILRWNMRNAVIFMDKNENIKIVKDNPKQRVDGAVALVMALAAYDDYAKRPSVNLEFVAF